MMATQGSFPQQFSEAIQEFPNFTSAYAQLSNGVDYIDLQIQVPEMLVQFCGNVHFGSGNADQSFIACFVFDLHFQLSKELSSTNPL